MTYRLELANSGTKEAGKVGTILTLIRTPQGLDVASTSPAEHASGNVAADGVVRLDGHLGHIVEPYNELETALGRRDGHGRSIVSVLMGKQEVSVPVSVASTESGATTSLAFTGQTDTTMKGAGVHVAVNLQATLAGGRVESASAQNTIDAHMLIRKVHVEQAWSLTRVPQDPMSLTRLSIDNPVVVGILTAVVIAAGILGSSNLGIVFVPDITAPTIAINATYSGASPAEMEQLVVKPIEDQIIGLHNEDTMQATIQEGEARIEVQLLLGADVDAALTDVQHRVDAARMYLPAVLDPPVVTKHFVGGGPILTDAVSTMGLSLAIGILVDDSIVVLENIHHQFALGRDRRSAAIVGRTQIGTAAVAITLVDVVVFLPIGFAAGLVGRVLREFGLVVAFATLVSLLVSFTLTPLLAVVDYANRERRDGSTASEAIRTAAARRFQPIVMTTTAMILGSLPLALGFAEGAAFRQSMGTVLIGGLVSSLLLTLVLIPVVYAATSRERAAERHRLVPPESHALAH